MRFWILRRFLHIQAIAQWLERSYVSVPRLSIRPHHSAAPTSPPHFFQKIINPA
jgi:hypothetical protein